LPRGKVPDQLARLYDDTEGQPLYVVETIRAGLAPSQISIAQTSAGLDIGRLPPKVYALIAARLGQLSGPARETAKLAATIGRRFDLELLVQASTTDIDSLVAPLDELWERQILRERGAAGYDFTHDRIREVAYAEIRPAQRKVLHRRVAGALEKAKAPDLDSVSAQLAAHYEQAGLPDRAILFYMRAADVAQRVYANEDAIDLLNRALTLFEFVPSGLSRDQRELTAQTALGVSLVATRGYAAPEVMDVYQRSRDLAQRLGKPLQPPLLRGLAIAAVAQTNFQFAQELGERMLDQAERDGDPVVLVEAHYVLGVTLFWRGQFAESRSHLEDAIAHYSVERSQAHLTGYSQNPAVVCLIRLAVVLWFLGDSYEATRCAEESLALARKVAHPFSLC
jgi:predicted ATPase